MAEDYVVRSLKYNGLDSFIEYLRDNKNLSQADIARLVKDVAPFLGKPKDVPLIVQRMQKMFGNLLKRPFPNITFKGDEPVIPAFDHFVDIEPGIRRDLFFKTNRMDDIYVGRVVDHESNFALVSLICFWSKEILIEDLEYKVYLEDPKKTYAVNTLLRVRLVEARIFERRLFVTANSKDFKNDGDPVLGVITEEDFPEHFKLRKRTEKDLAKYVKEKCSLVYDGHMTFTDRLPTFTNIKAVYKTEDLVSYQLKQQVTELSKKNFEEGLELIVRKPEKALELMEESFRLNPQNAHPLLYKGLILRNLGKYPLAIQAYKKAGEIGSENVDQYIVTCLERQIEEEDNDVEKFHLYAKLIKLNKKHKEAITFMTQFLVIKFMEEQNTIYENLGQDLEILFHNIHLDDGSGKESTESETNKFEIVTKQEPKDPSQAALYFFHKDLKDTLPAEPEVEVLPPVPKPTKRRESSGKYHSVSPLSDSSSKSSHSLDIRSLSVSPRRWRSHSQSPPRRLSRGNDSSKARSYKNSPFEDE